MSYSDTTPNLNLPQWTDQDEWDVDDLTGAMEAIDTSVDDVQRQANRLDTRAARIIEGFRTTDSSTSGTTTIPLTNYSIYLLLVTKVTVGASGFGAYFVSHISSDYKYLHELQSVSDISVSLEDSNLVLNRSSSYRYSLIRLTMP